MKPEERMSQEAYANVRR